EEEERKRQEEKERLKQMVREMRAHRIPCPSPCKVRVSKIDSFRKDDAFDFLFRNDDGQSLHFKLQLDEGRTLQEKEARLCLSKMLLDDKKDYTSGISYRMNRNIIQGCGCNWELHEYALLAYSEW